MASYVLIRTLAGADCIEDLGFVHPGMPHRLFDYADDYNEHRQWCGDLFALPCLFADGNNDLVKIELSESDRRKLFRENKSIFACYEGETTGVLVSTEYLTTPGDEPWIETCEISLISEEQKDELVREVKRWSAEATKRNAERAVSEDELAALMGDKSDYKTN